MNREDSAKVGGWLDHASKMARAVEQHGAEGAITALTEERDNTLAALRRRSAQRDQLDARCEELIDQRDAATSRAERAEEALERLEGERQRERDSFVLMGKSADGYRREMYAAAVVLERVRALHVRGQDKLAERLGLAVPDLCLADGETWPCPTVAALDVVRPAEDGPAERRKIFREGLGKLPIQFWVCPVPGHSQHREDAPLRQTVEWRAGVAHCLEPGCGRSSADAPAALDGWQPATCCDIHGRNCEPPSELCCDRCTEAAHDTFPIRHADGSTCSAPDLSDNAPATGETPSGEELDLEPPTFTMQPVPGRPGVVRPVLDKPLGPWLSQGLTDDEDDEDDDAI